MLFTFFSFWFKIYCITPFIYDSLLLKEARREEMMVNRLMRQSQQERRIAVQLLQARHEKEVIRNNRIICEQQYQERRLRDFEDALNREAVRFTSVLCYYYLPA